MLAEMAMFVPLFESVVQPSFWDRAEHWFEVSTTPPDRQHRAVTI
jgi:hypothetical protein